MKILSRKFTLRERILLLIMALVLVFAGYYKFVYQSTAEQIEEAKQKSAMLETELTTIQIQLARMEQMQKELESEKSDTTMNYMFSYNNINAEIEFLHQILDDETLDYRINFSEVERDGNQIRRPVSIQFTAENYKIAEQVVKELEKCNMRCLIPQIQMDSVAYQYADYNDLERGIINVNCSVIFYETMVGGHEDAGLPRNAQ